MRTISEDTADVASADETDEYDTDSDSDQNDDIMSRTTRFGRRITPVVRLHGFVRNLDCKNSVNIRMYALP